MEMQQQYDTKHGVSDDCCYQQWTHNTHQHQEVTVPSPMQQMEGNYYIMFIYTKIF